MDLYTYKLSMDVTYWLKLSANKITLDAMVNDFVEADPAKLDLSPEGLFALAKKVIPRQQYWDNQQYHTFRTDPTQPANESASKYILRKIDEMDRVKVKKDEIRNRVKLDFEKAAIEAGKHLKSKIIDIINDPDLGALIARDFLTVFEKFLSRHPRDVLARKDEELKQRQMKEQREYVVARDALSARLNSMFGLGGRLMELGTALSLTNIREEFSKLLS